MFPVQIKALIITFNEKMSDNVLDCRAAKQ